MAAAIGRIGFGLLGAAGAWYYGRSLVQSMKPHEQSQNAQTQADQAPSAKAASPNCQNCDDDDPNKKKDPNKGKKVTQDRSNLENKFKNYLLNPDENNQGNWKFFDQELGFNQSNWSGLADQLNFDQNSAIFDRTQVPGGDFYEQNITLNGVNGNTANVKATFAVENGAARLITVVPN